MGFAKLSNYLLSHETRMNYNKAFEIGKVSDGIGRIEAHKTTYERGRGGQRGYGSRLGTAGPEDA